MGKFDFFDLAIHNSHIQDDLKMNDLLIPASNPTQIQHHQQQQQQDSNTTSSSTSPTEQHQRRREEDLPQEGENQPQDQDQEQEEDEIVKQEEGDEEDDNHDDDDMEEIQENIRVADKIYSSTLLTGQEEYQEDYLLTLQRIEQSGAADDPFMIDELLDSFYQQQQAKAIEAKLTMALTDFQHQETLKTIAKEMELQKIHDFQEQAKESRRQSLQGINTILQRNLRFCQNNSQEKSILEKIRQELEGWIEDKTALISYESYEYLMETMGLKKTGGGKFQNILEEITEFPMEEDEEYNYDED